MRSLRQAFNFALSRPTRAGQDTNATPHEAQLCTIFGTVVYLDEPTGLLRHGAIGTSPANVLIADRHLPRREYLTYRNGGAWHRTPAHVKIIALDHELIAVGAEGFYLSAERDGNVTHSSTAIGPREHFCPVADDRDGDRITQITAMNTEPPGPEPVSTRYHLGSGGHFVPGYLNIDLIHDIEPDRVYSDFSGVAGAYFYNYDLSRGLPAADNSLDIIYHCHFLEHLSYPHAIELLRQARFRLKPGGVMRLLVPDLELWITNYQTNNTAFFDAYRRQILGDNAALYKTKASVFMGMLHNFGHQCGYDFETIDWLLKDSGFVNIRRTLFQESGIPDISTIEPYSPLRGMESLCVECQKPDASYR